MRRSCSYKTNASPSKELLYALEERARAVLGETIYADFLSSPSHNFAADGTSKIVLRADAKRLEGFILCANPRAPDMVERAMSRAREAKNRLGPILGAPIMEPLGEGRIGGLSYAILPYCNELTRSRILWRIQRTMVSGTLLRWLSNVTSKTLLDVKDSEREFRSALQALLSLAGLSTELLRRCDKALNRLSSGAWRPRRVLMHGDFWHGNVLLKTSKPKRALWRDRIAIIDWAGSLVVGYPIYDLVRLAQSLELHGSRMALELETHCRILECHPMDAQAYLLAALGHVSNTLEQFPVARFRTMAESCVAYIARVSS